MKKRIIIGIFLTTAVVFLYLFFTGRFARPNPLPTNTLSSYKLREKIDRSPKAQAQAARDFLSLLDEKMSWFSGAWMPFMCLFIWCASSINTTPRG